MINPVIFDSSKETSVEEGCLSIPVLEEIEASSIKIEYFNTWSWLKRS